jgi:hypothetical protein
MGVEEIRAELKDLHEVWNDLEISVGVDLADALDERGGGLWRELEDRLNAEYPDCPNCGPHADWGQERGEPLVCYSCDYVAGGEVREKVHNEWLRLQTGGGDEEVSD